MTPLALPLAAIVLAGCAATPPAPDPTMDLIKVNWCNQPHIYVITHRDGLGPQFINPDNGLIYDADSNQLAPFPPDLLAQLNQLPAHRITIPCTTRL